MKTQSTMPKFINLPKLISQYFPTSSSIWKISDATLDTFFSPQSFEEKIILSVASFFPFSDFFFSRKKKYSRDQMTAVLIDDNKFLPNFQWINFFAGSHKNYWKWKLAVVDAINDLHSLFKSCLCVNNITFHGVKNSLIKLWWHFNADDLMVVAWLKIKWTLHDSYEYM